MASENQVKQYLAYWFQLGKPLLVKGGEESLLPRPVISGDRYSQEFEDCWKRAIASDAGDCYLENTTQTLAELLSPAWEIDPCARCSMPVPMRAIGPIDPSCPCSDIPDWPNPTMPQPRSPVNTQAMLGNIRDRLRQRNYPQ